MDRSRRITRALAAWFLLFALVCPPESAPAAEAPSVKLAETTETAWRFEVSGDLPAGTYRYAVRDTSAEPRLCVWSAEMDINDAAPLAISVPKLSLVRSDAYGYRLVLAFFDDEGRRVAETRSETFRFPADGRPVLAERPEKMPAFPGAQGPGTTTPAGRGGKVYVVTRLDDYDEGEEPVPGTLRHAIEQEGPRQVVFAVGGMLRLDRILSIEHPRLTVAGNTAPFPGVTITRFPVQVRADHVVLRYLRVRLDIETMRERFKKEKDSGWDCFTGSRCEHVVFDHLSASHSVDETISFSPEVDRVTLSHSIAAYSLKSVFHDYYFSRGPDYKHTKRHNLGGLLAYLGKHDRHAMAAVHHTVYAHHTRRMPGLSAGRDDPENLISYIDIHNNVMYNWTDNATGIETGSKGRSRFHINYVGNYLKPGPNTPKRNRYACLKTMGHNKVHIEGNVHHADGKQTDQTALNRASRRRFLTDALPTPPVETTLFPSLEELASDTVGASIPCRESVDQRTIRDIREGTGHHPYVDMEKNTAPPVPQLPTVRRPVVNGDPFPAWWKRLQGLAPDERIHPHADSAGDGYTNIEAFMFGLRLDREPADWTVLKNNRNPLDSLTGTELAPLPRGTTALARESWSDKEQNETVFLYDGGRVLFASSTRTGGVEPAGVRNVLAPHREYWSPGPEDGERVEGVPGARSGDGPALVLAYPWPLTLAEIGVGKPHEDAFPASHDPARVRVEGLRGWPLHWEDLTGEVAVPPMEELTRRKAEISTHALVIPEEKRRPFAAYRVIFVETRGDAELRVQLVDALQQPH
jgi:hypothetical protein